MTAAGTTRVVRAGRPVPLGAVVSTFRRGGGDPTSRRDDDGWWFAWQTPAGPVTLRLEVPGGVGVDVTATAWGSGAEWALDRVPALLGEHDDPDGFEPRHPVVAEEWRRRPGWRVPASGLVLQHLVASIIEQKVTGKEAFAGYRRLVRRFGEPAPGPGEGLGLAVPPRAATGAPSRRGSGSLPVSTPAARAPWSGPPATPAGSTSAPTCPRTSHGRG